LYAGASEAVDRLDIEAEVSGGNCHVSVVRFHGYTLSLPRYDASTIFRFVFGTQKTGRANKSLMPTGGAPVTRV
jgi:hypothetical protein